RARRQGGIHSISIGEIFSARLLDRVGKGIRDAPRDALIADITPHGIRGAAFGLRQSLDTVGAIVGPLTAVGLMLLWNNDFRSVFWVASLPAVMCVALLYFGVQAPTVQSTGKPFNPITRENFKLLSHQFWWIVVLGACFALARFSEAFLVLRAQQCDVPMAYVPLIMMAMSIVYALTAYPFGKLSDDVSHVKLLAGGIAALASADLVLASSKDWRVLLCGVVLWGIHMGMTQGVFASMVAKVAPIELRGTAFGIFNLASGFGLLLSSGLAGLMWDQWGAIATFYLGAAFCGLSFCVLVWVAWGNSLRILSK
ncbi:MAG: MFS transporter, partial [Burkholderiales bacterium]|nr:MFS transporter [Burkholderiales bacterium]